VLEAQFATPTPLDTRPVTWASVRSPAGMDAVTTFRVLDLTTTLGGAYCAHLLSSGAVEVVHAEAPGGHPLRAWSASGRRVAPGESGPLFQWLAGGQHSVVVDPASEVDVAELLAWAATFDGVVWSPGAVVGVERLRAAIPDVTITAVTAFGLTGPWAGRVATEFTLQALSGAPGLRGSRAWPPMSAGGQHGEYMVGVFSAVATLLGLRRTVIAGGGGVLDVSGLESVMMTQLFNPHTLETQVDGVRPRRYKATVADVVATRDGYVGFAVVNRLQHWWDFCAMVGHPEWAEDRGLDSVVARTERCDELNPAIEAWCGERTKAEIVELAALMRIPCIEVGSGETIPTMDHFVEGRFHDVNPDGGFLQPAPPFRMHPSIAGVGEVQPAPPIGPPIRTLPRPVASSRTPPAAGSGTRPFDGLRVADFTSFWAGPFLGHVLGMFGADVIHVESAARPDGARLMNHHPRSVPQWWERSSYCHGTNTNKRGVTLDLSTDDGRRLARRLVAACDVVVENYSPRVMDSFGLSWDDVRALNPRAIMVRMPAFGLSGPWRDRTGFAMTMEQVSGMAWLCGFPEHRPGALFGPCDPGAGLHALAGLMFALEQRRRTGEGRLVECPMVANALNVAGEQVVEFTANGVRLDRTGNRGLAAAPQNCYPASDWDELDQHRWVSIAVATDEQWAALRAALGDPPWATRPELATMAGRIARHDELDAELGAWCAERKAAEIVDELWPAGVPCAVVAHPSENLTMAQLLERGFFEHVEHPVHGDSVIVTFPFRLPDETGPVHRRPAPLLGQHNTEVFGDLLGVPPDELARLEAAGIIGTSVSG
jgi:crotonobetainyl-CoA:carnitine CoA-transferase CaiB-like acyl-CoA transferase